MARRGYILIPDDLSEREDLTPGHKLVIGVLARLQGDKAFCYPSVQHLGKATGLSERQVQRIVADLRTRKEITVVGHRHQANTYSVPWATARALRKKWALEKQRPA